MKARKRPRSKGDRPAALKAYQDGLAVAERLAKADPGNPRPQRDLAVSYAKLANLDLEANRPTEGRALLDAGRAILVKFTADHPGSAQWKKDLDWFDARIAELGK